MKDLSQKVAYLQGLVEGLDLDDTSKEGKVINKMLDLLEDMTDEIQVMHMHLHENQEYLEALDEDLADLENEFYEEDEDDDDEDLYDFDEELIEVECPHCGEVVYFDEDYFDLDEEDEAACPNCGGMIAFDDDLLEDYDEEDETVED